MTISASHPQTPTKARAQLAEIKQANTERIETLTEALTSAQQTIAQLRQEREAATPAAPAPEAKTPGRRGRAKEQPE